MVSKFFSFYILRRVFFFDENRTYTAEFTVTRHTNRLTLGENSTYIKVTEPSSYKRFVMLVFLKNSF